MDSIKNIVAQVKSENIIVLPLTFLFVFLGWLYFNHKKVIGGTFVGSDDVDIGKEANEDDDMDEQDIHDELKQLQDKLGTDDIDEIKKAVNLDMNDPLSVKQYVTRLRSKAYKLELELSQTDKEREEEVKRQQLAQICALLNKNPETFGETSWTSENIEQQLSMYVQTVQT